MSGPLTDDEKAQILDHLGWSVGMFTQNYPLVYVQPVLNGLVNESSLTIVRGHLSRLNDIQTRLGAALDNFELDAAGNIKFASDVENRLWAQYHVWLSRLCLSLNVNPNIKQSSASGGRAIL